MAPVVQSCPSKSYMMTYTKLHMSKETEMILGNVSSTLTSKINTRGAIHINIETTYGESWHHLEFSLKTLDVVGLSSVTLWDSTIGLANWGGALHFEGITLLSLPGKVLARALVRKVTRTSDLGKNKSFHLDQDLQGNVWVFRSLPYWSTGVLWSSKRH